MSKVLLLIDASNWIFRAYHALPPLTAPDKTPTGAVYGFGNMLKRLHKEYPAERIAVVFDASGESFRNQIFADYKANRSETPEDLKPQFALVQQMVATQGLPLLVVPDVEADDVIGTLAKQGEAAGMEVLIVSGDKDMAQLVNERVNLLDTMKNRRMGPAGVVEKFGVTPAQIIDYLALMGDAVDNIPGVPGVGPKTAAKLFTEAIEEISMKQIEGVRATGASFMNVVTFGVLPTRPETGFGYIRTGARPGGALSALPVLALLLQGKPNKLIARELNVSVETVKDHVAAVLRALAAPQLGVGPTAVSVLGNKPVTLAPHLQRIADEARPHYERLAKWKL